MSLLNSLQQYFFKKEIAGQHETKILTLVTFVQNIF